MCKVTIQGLQQMFKANHQKQTWEGLHYQVCLMGHAMDPQRIGSIIIMDFFCDTNICPLKNINTIYPKTNKLMGNLILWQTTTYHENLHNNLD
jgi:hypothetical protein